MFSDFSTLDVILIFLFIIFNVVVGFSTRGFVKDFKSYASLGNENFNTIVIVATISALFCSGSLLVGGIEQINKEGLFMIWFYFITEMIACVFALHFYIHRIIKIKTYSLHQYVGHFYGTNIRVFFALSEVIQRVGRFAIQLNLIKKCVGFIFNFNQNSTFLLNFIVFVIAIILIAYSSFGGLKAISYTDVLQFFTFFIIIPVLAFYMWYKTGVKYGNHDSFYKIFKGEVPIFTLKETIKGPVEIIAILSVLSRTILTTPLNIPYFQRIRMCRTEKKAKKVWAISTIIYGTIVLLICFIGMQLYSIISNEIANGTIKINDKIITEKTRGEINFISYMLLFLDNSTISIIFLICIISLSISTSDSEFNGIAVLFSNDILFKINSKMYQNRKAANISSIIACLFSLFLCFYLDDIFNILMFVQNFFLPVVVIPLSFTVFGFRTHKNAIWAAVVAGIIASLLCSISLGFIYNYSYHNWYLIGSIQDFLGVSEGCNLSKFSKYSFGIGMLANLIALISAHYYYKKIKGFKFVEENKNNCVFLSKEIDNKIRNAKDKLFKKIRSLSEFKKLGIAEKKEVDIVRNFFSFDFIRNLPEYQEYKELLFTYVLGKKFIKNDPVSDLDKDFQYQLVFYCEKFLYSDVNSNDEK